jgi:hypothetical protein
MFLVFIILRENHRKLTILICKSMLLLNIIYSMCVFIQKNKNKKYIKNNSLAIMTQKNRQLITIIISIHK